MKDRWEIGRGRTKGESNERKKARRGMEQNRKKKGGKQSVDIFPADGTGFIDKLTVNAGKR